MTQELYPNVEPGDPITAELFNRLQDFARRKDSLRTGTNIISTQGHVESDAVEFPELLLVRVNKDVLPGKPDSDELNATVLAWDYDAYRPVDTAEITQVLMKTYLLPVRKNDVVIATYNEVAQAFIPVLVDFVADLKVDGNTRISGIASGHIQLPKNNSFDDPYQEPPARFDTGPMVYIQPVGGVTAAKTGDEMIGHYTGLYKIDNDIRPLFRFGGGAGGGGGTVTQDQLPVPLRVISQQPTGNLYPALVLNYNAATDTFSDSTVQCWAITTNHDTLDVISYTGIYLGMGGAPRKPIYCINDNWMVSLSNGAQKQIGLNWLMFAPPHGWNIQPGPQPGQAVVTNIFAGLQVQNDVVIQEVVIIVFAPPNVWELQNLGPAPNGGFIASVKRKLEVAQGVTATYRDVWRFVFAPDCMWDVQQNGPGVVNVRRLLSATTDKPGAVPVNDIAKMVFVPDCTWSIKPGDNPCFVNIKRLLTFQTDLAEYIPFEDIAHVTLIPNCCWEIMNDPSEPCGILVRRRFVVEDDNPSEFQQQVIDVARITFQPACCWDIKPGDPCQVKVKRILNFSGADSSGAVSNVTDVSQVTFSRDDFILSSPLLGGQCNATIYTRGLSQTICVCGCDGLFHYLTFTDGLLTAYR